jgi:sarcosine oxidase subunit alpha
MRLSIDGVGYEVAEGTSVAAALLNAGVAGFRTSVAGEPRLPLCGMGICFVCRATIDGVPHERTCLVLCKEGMEVRTDA